ncbi:MAG: type IV toxin-antitoxin system AbiEi family antitoxin domain-containing protein [Actinomycetota bacterium]|nr:type IV toxin-antitoxin system AbiEi family antitoxin domain-containing protein [Actinomycetota bacterium]
MDSWQQLSELGRRQFGAVALGQAVALGLSPRTLQRRVEAAGWQRLHRSVYALPGSTASYERSAMAAVLAIPTPALVAARSAARLWRISEARQWPIQLVVPAGHSNTRLRDVTIRRSTTLAAADRAFVDAICVTAVPRTVCDLAGCAGIGELTEAIAVAVQRRLVRLVDVERRAAELGAFPGRARLRVALAELGRHGRTDSRLERDVRRLLCRKGLAPHPGIYPLVSDDGWLIAALDIAYVSEQVCLEVDGMGWHASPREQSQDHARDNEIKAHDWLPMHIGAAELLAHPQRFVRQLREVLSLRRGHARRRIEAFASNTSPMLQEGG